MPFMVPRRFEGAPGRAQGGYAAGLLHDEQPRRVWFRSAVPLETQLELTPNGSTASVTLDGNVILESHPVDPLEHPLPMVTMDQAVVSREWAESTGLPQRVATCYSCGMVESTLRTHPGPVGDSKIWATPMAYPEWTAEGSRVDPKHLWAVLDCASGYPVALGKEPRTAFTGWLSVDVRAAIEPGRPALVVATADPWEGRKRSAQSALWSVDGELIAVSESLWISVGEGQWPA